MKRSPLGFFIALALATVALIALIAFLRPKTITPVTSQSIDAVALATSYTISVRDIVTAYRTSPNPAGAKIAEQKLLNLAVPQERRDFHLDLVLALHRLSGVRQGDTKAVETARSAVEKLIGADWLR